MYDYESNYGKTQGNYGRSKLGYKDDDFIRKTDKGYDRWTRKGYGETHEGSMSQIMDAYSEYRESEQW